jgi:hypothetical protein
MKFRCGRCGEMKPLAEFNSRSGKRSSYCTLCQRKVSREHYRKNRARYVERARLRTRREQKKRMEWLHSYFKEHPCVDCGETDIMVLEFDHLRDKSFDIGHELRNVSWVRVLEEIAKCDVVCGNCHRRRTARKANYLRHVLTRVPRQGRFPFE